VVGVSADANPAIKADLEAIYMAIAPTNII
jgi:hypothetical protein